MNHIGILLTIFLSFKISATVKVEEPGKTYNSKNGTKIIYVNGQENEMVDALRSITFLEDLVEINRLNYLIDINEKVEFSLVFNKTFGLNDSGDAVADFMESLVLLTLDKYEDMSLDEVWRSVYHTAMNLYAKESLKLKNTDGVFDLFNDSGAFQTLYNSTGEIGVNLQDEIVKTLAADKNLILISHSQGNIFVNVAYQDLVNNNVIVRDNKTIDMFKHRIGNLQVATPTSNIEIEEYEYLTNDKDKILTVPGRLSPNFGLITPPLPDPRKGKDSENNHSLLLTYVSSSNEGNLRQLRNTFFQKLVDLSSRLGAGINDCNNDNVEDDFAFETIHGGFISPDSEVAEGFGVVDNARVCGDSRITADIGLISGDYIVENTTIGSSCSYLDISSDSSFNFIENSNICIGDNAALYTNFDLRNTTITNSTLNPIPGRESNTISFSNSMIENSMFTNADIIANNSDFTNGFVYSGISIIENSTFDQGYYKSAMIRTFLGTGSELISFASGAKSMNGRVEGIVFLQGDVNNSDYIGNNYFELPNGDFYVNHLRGGTVTNSTVRGNLELRGTVNNALVDALSNNFYRSFIGSAGGIANGEALGYVSIVGSVFSGGGLYSQCYVSGKIGFFNTNYENGDVYCDFSN